MEKHVFKFNSPPKNVPTNGTHDAPFTGNGDLAVMLSGSDDRVQLYISKADFWSGQEMLNGDTSGGERVAAKAGIYTTDTAPLDVLYIEST